MKCKDCTVRKTNTGHSQLALSARCEWANGMRAAALACILIILRPTVGLADDTATIRLWPTAVVTSDAVMLEDIAQLSQGDADLLSKLRLCRILSAPPAGNSTVLTLNDVTKAIAAAGVNPTRILMRGSSRCLISRPAESASKAPTSQPALPAQAASATTRSAADPAAEPGTLEETLRQYFIARLANLAGKVQVRFSPAARKALALSKPTYDFRIRHRDGELLGLVGLEVDVLENGSVADTVPIIAEVAVLKPVVMARTPINRGETIETKHVMLMEQRFVRISEIGITDMQSVIGQEATAFLDRGRMISFRDVRVKPLVRRGELVTVWVRNGELVIKTAAKALTAGTYGDSIEVKNEATGESYAVTVTGPQTAEVRDRGTVGLVAQSRSDQ